MGTGAGDGLSPGEQAQHAGPVEYSLPEPIGGTRDLPIWLPLGAPGLREPGGRQSSWLIKGSTPQTRPVRVMLGVPQGLPPVSEGRDEEFQAGGRQGGQRERQRGGEEEAIRNMSYGNRPPSPAPHRTHKRT